MATWTHLQSNDAPTVGPLAFSGAVADGSLLIAGIESADSSFPFAIPTDSLGNDYALINEIQTGNGQAICWWYAISEAAGANTVTFESLGLIFSGCFVSEYSCDGTDIALDVEDIIERGSISIGTDTAASPNVVASEDDSLVLGIFGTDNGNGSTNTAGTNFTLRAETTLDSSSGDGLLSESRQLASAGSVAATFSLAGNIHRGAVGVAVFKATFGVEAPSDFIVPMGMI